MFQRQNRLFPVIISLALLFGCSDSSKDIAELTQVVARVNDREITTSFVERRLKRISPIVRRAMNNEKAQKKFIDSLVSNELILQAAKAEDLHKTHTYMTQVRDYKSELLVKMFLQKKLINQKLTVTKEEVEKYYNDHQDNFKEQQELRLSHIILLSEVEAKDILKRIENGEEFAKLAYEKSANRKTAARGGDMGFIRKWQLPPSVAEEIFSMETERISEVIPSDFGYAILKVTGKRMGKAVPIDAVGAVIQRKLITDKQKEIIEKLVEDLKKKAKVTVNESVIASLHFSPGEEQLRGVKSKEEQPSEEVKSKPGISIKTHSE